MKNFPRLYAKLIALFLFLLVGLSHTAVLHASPVVFIRDYTYNASEKDSKVSARKAALEQLQRSVLEEVGVQVQASFSNTESFSKGQLKQDVLSNFSTFSQALTKTKILEEKWNGERFYIKAEIEVDPKGVTVAMDALTSNNTDICTQNKEKVQELSQKAETPENNQALVDIALTSHFDRKCNKWQYDVLSFLTSHSNYPIADYRAFIFSQLEIAPSDELPHLMPKVIYYAIQHSDDITAKEWNVVLKEIERMPVKYVSHVVRVLSNLDAENYQNRINDILALAVDGVLGSPSLDKETALHAIIKVSLKKHMPFVAQLYLDHADVLSDKNKQASIVRKIYEKGYSKAITTKNPESTKLADQVIKHFLTSTDLEKLDNRARAALYGLVKPLMNEQLRQKRQSHDNQHLKALLKKYPSQFVYLVESQRISASKKALFLQKYNLSNNSLCQPSECIEQVLNRDLKVSEQNTYLDYLVSYGEKAKSVEKSVIELLDSAQGLPMSIYRTQRKKALITILRNINSTEHKTITLLLESLEDPDHRVPYEAIQTLTAIDQPAFKLIASSFNRSSGLRQHRMIEAIGKMKPSADIVQFLKSISVSNNKRMQFAVEKAIDAHTS